MPLRGHFRPPLANAALWEDLHGLWPGVMTLRLNNILPPGYRSGVRVRLGTAVEIDVAAYELDEPTGGSGDGGGGTAVAWAPAKPSVLLDTETPIPPEYEVRLYDVKHARTLVAAVEIVSPDNKDREESR